MLLSTRIPGELAAINNPAIGCHLPPSPLRRSFGNPHANLPRQWIRHGLSRGRRRAAAGLRAWYAGRFSHLVGGTWTALEKASRDRGVAAAVFSRALGRRRRRLSDRSACRRPDRLHRAPGCEAGGPDGTFPRRPYRVPGGAATARFVAPAGAGRARRRTGFLARPRRNARLVIPRHEDRRVGRQGRGRRYRWRAEDFLRCDRGRRRMGAAARGAEAAAARQRLYPDRPGRRKSSAPVSY